MSQNLTSGEAKLPAKNSKQDLSALGQKLQLLNNTKNLM